VNDIAFGHRISKRLTQFVLQVEGPFCQRLGPFYAIIKIRCSFFGNRWHKNRTLPDQKETEHHWDSGLAMASPQQVLRRLFIRPERRDLALPMLR
jgi:hypothetical protein